MNHLLINTKAYIKVLIIAIILMILANKFT